MSNTLKRFDIAICGLAVIMERYLADLKAIRPQWGVLEQEQEETLEKLRALAPSSLKRGFELLGNAYVDYRSEQARGDYPLCAVKLLTTAGLTAYTTGTPSTVRLSFDSIARGERTEITNLGEATKNRITISRQAIHGAVRDMEEYGETNTRWGIATGCTATVRSLNGGTFSGLTLFEVCSTNGEKYKLGMSVKNLRELEQFFAETSKRIDHLYSRR